MAEGEIVGLLDHDDTLEPNALYEVVKALQDKDVDTLILGCTHYPLKY